MSRIVFAVVAVVAIGLGVVACFDGLDSAKSTITDTAGLPTDLVAETPYEVADTFVCDDNGDKTHQVREWRFGGADRSIRSQQTIDWYLDLDGRKVTRIEYQPESERFLQHNGKKYMMVRRRMEWEQAREGFDANGDNDKRRWADVVIHNIKLEPQTDVPPCGPERW